MPLMLTVEQIQRSKASAPVRALPGRPSLVASREELEFGKSANLVPAALLLWAVSGGGDSVA